MAETGDTLDGRLKDAAIAVRNTIGPGSMAENLAVWLATVTQAQLQAPPYSYSVNKAFAVKLFGDDLTLLIAAWDGAALAALSPSLSTLAVTFTGPD